MSVSITVAAVLIFFVDEIKHRVEARYVLNLHTFTTQTLRVRAPVWLAGQRVGYVQGLAFEPPTRGAGERLRVTLSLKSSVQPLVTDGASAQVITSGLLGEAVVNILPAHLPGPALSHGEELRESPELDLYDVTRKLRALYDSMPPVAERWEEILRRAREGPGTLARLSGSQSELAAFQRKMTQISGTFGALRGAATNLATVATDDEVQAALGRISSRLSRLAAEWQEGRSTASALVRDTLIASRIEGTVESADRIVQRLDSGRGTLGRFLKDQALRTELERTREMLRELRSELGGPQTGRPQGN